MKKFIAAIMASALILSATMFVSAKGISYSCKGGDTMYKIASKYQISLAELLKANPGVNANNIKDGQKINVPQADSLSAMEAEVLRLCNVERAKVGLAALKANSNAAYVARLKSQDMIDKKYFAHQSPTYGSPFNMMEHFGLRFSAAGENIAYGQRTAAEVMNAWMNSPGHKANILNKSFTDLGVGAAKAANGTCYWTQMFLKPTK